MIQNTGGTLIHGSSKHNSTVDIKTLSVIDAAGYSKIASGSYTGNDTANRAISHGLGKVPKLIFFQATNTIVEISGLSVRLGVYNAMISGLPTYASAVTAADATNFYVGSAANYEYSGNGDTHTYYWVVLA